jgi:hypothetical protein
MAQEDASENVPAGGAVRRERLTHLRQAFAMSGTMLTALVALISGALALFFTIRPDLTPDPRTHLGASASIFAVDDGVTLGSFLERRHAIVSDEEYAKEKQAYIRQASAGAGDANGSTVLTLPGEDVFVNATIQGFKSRSVAMLASMYDADRHTRVRELSDVPVFQQHVEAPSDQSVVEFWLPAPPVNVKRYFVRVQVYHRGDGVLLGIADSRPIVAR